LLKKTVGCRRSTNFSVDEETQGEEEKNMGGEEIVTLREGRGKGVLKTRCKEGFATLG